MAEVFELSRSDSVERAHTEPFVAGPRGGKAIVGFDDGERSTLLLVSLDSGSFEEVLVSEQPIFHAALDPTADALYYVLVDRATLTEGGIWRRTLSDPAATPELLREPLPVGDGDGNRVGRIWLTPDGSTLVNVRGFRTQLYEAISPAGGQSTVSQLQPWADFGGITDEFVLGSCLCAQGGVLVVDVEQMVALELPDESEAVTAVSRNGRPAVAVFRWDATTSVVYGIDLLTGDVGPTWRGDSGWQLVSPATEIAFEVPPGTVLISKGGVVDPSRTLAMGFLLNMETGLVEVVATP